MYRKLKLVTILGTRPEIIRMSSIIKKFDLYFEHILIHTGQNYDYELNEIFFEDLGLRKPNYFLEAANPSPIKTMANIMTKTDDILSEINPDATFILGDTNSSIAGLVAKRKKIPLFHFEAGNRCFDQRVPEEINRKFIDHIADVNLTYSSIAREYLISEGISKDLIIKIGSPMNEVIKSNFKKIKNSKILNYLKLKKNDFILCSIHREENVETPKKLINIIEALNYVCNKFEKKVLISLHPRTKIKLKELNLNLSEKLIFHKPFNFTDYINLQTNSFFVISDSGTINEEASILKLNAVNLRDAHERPEASEDAITIMSGIDKEAIIKACLIIADQDTNTISLVNDYSYENISSKLVKIVQSYTGYINRIIWKKY